MITKRGRAVRNECKEDLPFTKLHDPSITCFCVVDVPNSVFYISTCTRPMTSKMTRWKLIVRSFHPEIHITV